MATPPPHTSSSSRRALARVALLFGPVVLAITFIKLFEYSALQLHRLPSLGRLLWWNAPLFLFVATLTGILAALLHRRRPKLKAFGLSAVTVGLLAGGLALAKVLLPPSTAVQAGWISPEAFEFVRWDLLVILSTALLGFLLLNHLHGPAQTTARLLLHTLALVLLLLPTVELGYLIVTGIPGDWTLIEQGLANFSELAPVIANQLDVRLGLLLLLPVALVLAPFGLEHLPAVQRWIAAPSRSGPQAASVQRQLFGAITPVLLLLILPPAADLALGHPSSAYANAARHLTRTDAATRTLQQVEVHRRDPPFDAATLRLAATDSTRTPNVVVILLESVRRRSTTPYDSSLVTTPFLDSLARHGLLVNDMYAVTPYTNKALTPVLAGIYPHPGHLVQEATPGGLPGPGLPTLLQPHGYRSAFFTPARLGFENKDQLLENLGFDAYYGAGDYPTKGFARTHIFGREDHVMLQPSLAWADSVHRAGRPFLLSYLTLTSHHDYQTPPDFETRDYGVADEDLNRYLNAIRYTDGFLRDLMAGFRRRGLLRETLFVIVGDHGEAFGEHGRRTHGDIIWDEALEVPALVYSPALIPDGRRAGGLRSHLDVLPTIADALNLGIENGHLPGRSLLQPVAKDRAIYHHTHLGSNTMALRRDSLKYIYQYGRRPMQVFNLKRDPLERRDIAGTLSPARRKAIATELLLWRKGVEREYQHSSGQVLANNPHTTK